MKLAWLLPCLGLFATAAFGQEREWAFDSNNEDAFLVFGVPESDDVGVSFWCKTRSGEIHIFLAEAGERLPLKKKARLRISVGGKTYSFDARVSSNEEAGSMSIDAVARADSPVFAVLSKASSFTTRVVNGDKSAFPLPGADFDSLMRACARG